MFEFNFHFFLNFTTSGCSNVGSTTRYVYRMVTPSAACPLNSRLCPQEKYKRECGDRTRHMGLETLDSKGTGRCC